MKLMAVFFVFLAIIGAAARPVFSSVASERQEVKSPLLAYGYESEDGKTKQGGGGGQTTSQGS